jgi:hypothetical protein
MSWYSPIVGEIVRKGVLGVGEGVNVSDSVILEINRMVLQYNLLMFAGYLFTVLSLCYVLKMLRITWAHDFGLLVQKSNPISHVARLAVRIQKFLVDSQFVHVLGVLGLILILVIISLVN